MNWNSIRFDWNHARAFLVTAQEGSLSVASRALGMTQPTLSRQITALEQSLDLVLFERVGKGMLLTAAGEQLLEHVKQMGEAANRFSLTASGQSQCLEGDVCISASEIDALLRLPDIIRHIHRQEPGIRIEIIATNEVSDLHRREADIAIRSFRPTQEDLIARKLCDERIWFFGHRDYLSELRECSSEEMFERVRIIAFEKSDRLIDMVTPKGWRVSQANFPVISKAHMLHWQLVRAGMGLGLFPEEIGLNDPELQIALPELGPPMTLPLWLVSHRELRTNPRVRRVFEILADCLDGTE